MVIRIPSLVDLCVQTAIDNIKYIGDVGETDINLLKFILPHCTADQLMHIEASSYGRDLTAVTDNLWKKHYEQLFGVENANVVIKRMKKVQRSYKWRDLYKAKLKERDEAQKKSVDRLKNLYAQEVLRKQSRQIRLCSKIPPSVNKRSYFEGSGSCSSFSNVKGNLMKKAKMEYLNSHEAKVHAAMRKNALQKKSNLQSRYKCWCLLRAKSHGYFSKVHVPVSPYSYSKWCFSNGKTKQFHFERVIIILQFQDCCSISEETPVVTTAPYVSEC